MELNRHMKYFFMLAMTFLNLPAMAGCIFHVEHGQNYCISIWKHVEDKDDTVEVKNYTDDQLKQIVGILSQYKSVKLSFNKGVFNSLSFNDSIIKRWATLSPGEKDMVLYIEKNWNITE